MRSKNVNDAAPDPVNCCSAVVEDHSSLSAEALRNRAHWTTAIGPKHKIGVPRGQYIVRVRPGLTDRPDVKPYSAIRCPDL